MKKITLVLVYLAFGVSAWAQTFTPNFQLQLPPRGAQNWDTAVNGNFTAIDTAMGQFQAIFQGPWSNTGVYAKGVWVSFNNGLYQSKINSNFNNQPDISPLSWTLMQTLVAVFPTAASTGAGITMSGGGSGLAYLDGSSGTNGQGGYLEFTNNAGNVAGYGAWLLHNAYYNGTDWIQPRGTLPSQLFTVNNHLSFSWRQAAATGTNNTAITGTLSEWMALSSGGLNLETGNYQINGTQISATNLSNGTTGTGALVLANSPSFTSGATFNGLVLHNTQGTATNISNFSSNIGRYLATFWTGSASANDIWDCFASVGSGTNPTSGAFNCSHAGNGVTTNPSVAFTDNNAATAGANFNAPVLVLNGHYWNGSASTQGGLQQQLAFGTGANPTVNYNVTLPATGGALTTVFNSHLTIPTSAKFTGGSLVLNGATSGSVTLTVPAAAGTSTATLPANTGTVAETNLAQSFTAAQTISAVLAITNNTGLTVSGTGGQIVGGLGTPSVRRDYIGDGTGWRLEWAKRTASVDTLEGWLTDSGVLNIVTGIQVNGAAPSGNVLRGNGTNFVASTLAAADLSNGVTGSGAVVLGTSPTISTPSVSSPSTTGTDSGTETLTNKRITPRLTSTSLSTAAPFTITPASDTLDINAWVLTGTGGTLTIAAPTGTPTDGQKLLLRIKSTNAMTYSFVAGAGAYKFSTTVTAPATLGAGLTDYIGCMWNATNGVWDVVAVDQGH